MTRKKIEYKSSPFGGVIALLLFAGLIFLLFYMVKGVFSILSFLAPILFILALVFNRHVVFDYGKMLWHKLKTDTPKGLLYTLLSIVGFPVVSAFLFFKAFITQKVKKMSKTEEEYDDYEEVVEEEDFLELPELEKPKQGKTQREDNSYDDLFK